jgi:hypothetical protein
MRVNIAHEKNRYPAAAIDNSRNQLVIRHNKQQRFETAIACLPVGEI